MCHGLQDVERIRRLLPTTVNARGGTLKGLIRLIMEADSKEVRAELYESYMKLAKQSPKPEISSR